MKGSQFGGGGESIADTVAGRADLMLPGDQDKSDQDRSGDSVPRGRRERSGPPRFHRGLYIADILVVAVEAVCRH